MNGIGKRVSRLGGMVVWVAGLLAVVGASASWSREVGVRSSGAEPVRIGTYDSRAVGLAYGRSRAHGEALRELMDEYAKAKEEKNTGRMKELERKGELRQVRMHLQVFSNARVDDALDTVREELAGVAARAGVGAIVDVLDYHDATVEPVDVTDELVGLFDPTPETLKLIADGRAKEPLPIEEIAQLPARD